MTFMPTTSQKKSRACALSATLIAGTLALATLSTPALAVFDEPKKGAEQTDAPAATPAAQAALEAGLAAVKEAEAGVGRLKQGAQPPAASAAAPASAAPPELKDDELSQMQREIGVTLGTASARPLEAASLTAARLFGTLSSTGSSDSTYQLELRVVGDRLEGPVTRRTSLGPRANVAVTLWAELARER